VVARINFPPSPPPAPGFHASALHSALPESNSPDPFRDFVSPPRSWIFLFKFLFSWTSRPFPLLPSFFPSLLPSSALSGSSVFPRIFVQGRRCFFPPPSALSSRSPISGTGTLSSSRQVFPRPRLCWLSGEIRPTADPRSRVFVTSFSDHEVDECWLSFFERGFCFSSFFPITAGALEFPESLDPPCSISVEDCAFLESLDALFFSPPPPFSGRRSGCFSCGGLRSIWSF